MKLFCPVCRSGVAVVEGRVSQVCRGCGRGLEVWPVKRAADGPVVAAPAVTGAAPPSGDPGEVQAAVDAGVAEQRPSCAKHPNNAAERTCGRCGDYMCAICATPVEGRLMCVKCFEHVEGAGELASARTSFKMPTFSMWLGIVSIVFGWANCIGLVLGPTAVVLGILALRQIAAKPALPGRGSAIAGIVCGSIGFVVTIGVYVVIVAMAAERGGGY